MYTTGNYKVFRFSLLNSIINTNHVSISYYNVENDYFIRFFYIFFSDNDHINESLEGFAKEWEIYWNKILNSLQIPDVKEGVYNKLLLCRILH